MPGVAGGDGGRVGGGRVRGVIYIQICLQLRKEANIKNPELLPLKVYFTAGLIPSTFQGIRTTELGCTI